jgi:hypothetical protein
MAAASDKTDFCLLVSAALVEIGMVFNVSTRLWYSIPSDNDHYLRHNTYERSFLGTITG